MNKLTMSRWVLGLSSMMLGALAVGCVGAPAGDEETATEAPITPEERATSDAERLAKVEAEGIETPLDGMVLPGGKEGASPDNVRVICINRDIDDVCCFYFDDGDVICLGPSGF